MEKITLAQLRQNVAEIRERMEKAALAAGRKPEEIILCAASKLHDADTVRLAAGLPIDIFGENHVQELVAKNAVGAYQGKPLHFIGHLQTNKVKQVVGVADVIQSVDSFHLLTAMEKQAEKLQKTQKILLEVNIAGETSKSGVAPETLPVLLEQAADCPHLQVCGLMTVPPVATDDVVNRRQFAALRRLLEESRRRWPENQSLTQLSMGMSGDFENAIAEGATIVRVGTAIFGARDYSG